MKQFNPQEVNFIQDRACERVSEIFDSFGLEYMIRNDYIQCVCPIHCGDNPRALYWAMQTSHWKCTTRQCQEEAITGHSNSIFGFVRGVMSQRTQEQWSFNRSVLYVAKILNLDNIALDKETEDDIEINKAIKKYKQRQKTQCPVGGIPLSDAIKDLKPDTVYYPSRGISQTTIMKYHIAYCDNSQKPFFRRAFFPILDATGRYVVGWSGRSSWEKCDQCNVYHEPKICCPTGQAKAFYAKWKHSKGFKSEHHLYNYWYAHPFIAKNGTAIICEGPGNCWALDDAGINNSVAIFGLAMSKAQRILLQKAGALTLIFALDNDEAGKKAAKRLEKQLQYYFRLFFVEPESDDDVGSMSSEVIKRQFGDLLKKTNCNMSV